MGLFSRKRFVVATILVGLEDPGRRRVFDVVSGAMQRIVESDGEFEVASEAIAQVAQVLLEYESAWTYSANWGEVFSKEEDAARYGEDSFADCSGRYLSDTDGSGEDEEPVEEHGGVSVVMLTIAYEGETPQLEKTLATKQELADGLAAIVALHRREQLLLAHVHQSPGTIDETLTEDQMTVNYPEMMSL